MYTPQQMRFGDACRVLLEIDIKPTPTELEKIDPSFVNREGKNVWLKNGRLTIVRTEEFIRAGWTKGKNGRWEAPRA